MSQTGQSPPSIEKGKLRRARMTQAKRLAEFDRQLITPEGAELTLKLGSASQRAGAFIIDWIIIILLFVGLLYGIGETAKVLGQDGDEILSAIAMLLIFSLRNFYFIFFETGRRAATPGKRLLGLRVTSRNGGQLTSNAILARNFVREVEVFLPLGFLLQGAFGGGGLNGWISLFGLIWSAVFLFMPALNKDKLRLGDIIAGTWVIHAPKIKLLGDITKTTGRAPATPSRFTFTAEQLDAYGIHELHILENLLRKSTPQVRASVAERIRAKIGWTRLPDETDREFLAEYYAGLRRNLEQKLLMGQRKADKFDKT